MTSNNKVIIQRVCFVVLILFYNICLFESCTKITGDNFILMEREPVISPDYSEVTIPPNIAPMNFKISENGISFGVFVTSSNGTKTIIKSKDPVIRFSNKEWKKLVKDVRGGKISIEVYSVNDKKELIKYFPFNIYIADDPIDPYICYRMLYPGYETWSQIKIIQRNIENFDENSLIENQLIDKNCVNCHSFNKNNPEEFLIHLRGSAGGTYFVNNKTIIRKDLKTRDMKFGAVYPAWHPEGRFVAFSSNNIIQTFHSIPDKNIEVIDLSSSLVLYDTKNNEMLHPGAEDTVAFMETYPEWSPDGKYLYYCRAKQFIEGSDFRNIKYELVRRAFDQSTRSFGNTEPVFNAPGMDKSVSFPRISPDGRNLIFTLHNYGNFPIWHKEADLYMLDLHSGELTRLSLNSNETDSYHSWSSNSRWLVFSSKRDDGLTARLYFAHIGPMDQIGKPFVLPQKNPNMYDHLLKTYNRPEFITGKIKLDPHDFARATEEIAIKALEAAKPIDSSYSGSLIR